jgi:pre-mRNA cleavage complex 2 protein Pcf11
VSTIDIDHQPRDIRFYGEKATVVMGPGDVRELLFRIDGPDKFRRVIIDDMIFLKLPVNSPVHTTFKLSGQEHTIKLGAPTRELWIDGKWYQCYFNECVRVQLGSLFHKVFLEGPPPNVTIGQVSILNNRFHILLLSDKIKVINIIYGFKIL